MQLEKFLSLFRNKGNQNLNRFLKDVSGVIHIGANAGQERELYQRHNLDVIWIEANPEIYSRLEFNIAEYEKQSAYNSLMTDIDGRGYKFHISNNNGHSSSIFELKEHKNIWPNVDYEKCIEIESMTLASFFEKERFDPGKYGALVIDTQGSELLVLKGSLPVLQNFKYIKVEVADFEIYEGCCQLSDINDFMNENGYEEQNRKNFTSVAGVGNCFDVVYKKV